MTPSTSGTPAGGGDAARCLGRHGETRVAKAALISAVTPPVPQTDANPAGVPQAAFEGLHAQLAANRSEFYRAVPSGPFYNFGRPGVQASEAVLVNRWRQGMTGKDIPRLPELPKLAAGGMILRDADATLAKAVGDGTAKLAAGTLDDARAFFANFDPPAREHITLADR